jgi:hypothetical protein
MKSFFLEKTVSLKLLFLTAEKTVEPNDIDVSFTMVTNISDDDIDIEEAQLQQNISYTKATHFLTDVMDQSFVFGYDDLEKATECLSTFSNNFVVLPNMDENTLIACIHSKLNAIVDSHTTVDRVRLHDRNEQLTFEYFMVDDQYTELPTEAEWGSELSYWKGCWWSRNDINTMDRIASSEEELARWNEMREEHNLEQLNVQLFDDIEGAFREAANADAAGEVIEVDFAASDVKRGHHVWKPVVID